MARASHWHRTVVEGPSTISSGRAAPTRRAIARAGLEQALGRPPRVFVAGAGLDARRQEVVGDPLRDPPQDEGSARVVEIGEAVREGRKLGAHVSEIEGHRQACSMGDAEPSTSNGSCVWWTMQSSGVPRSHMNMRKSPSGPMARIGACQTLRA